MYTGVYINWSVSVSLSVSLSVSVHNHTFFYIYIYIYMCTQFYLRHIFHAWLDVYEVPRRLKCFYTIKSLNQETEHQVWMERAAWALLCTLDREYESKLVCIITYAYIDIYIYSYQYICTYILFLYGERERLSYIRFMIFDMISYSA